MSASKDVNTSCTNKIENNEIITETVENLITSINQNEKSESENIEKCEQKTVDFLKLLKQIKKLIEKGIFVRRM